MFGKVLNRCKGNCVLIFVIALAATVGSVPAQQVPANRLLLPYFEVSLDGSGNNTVFSVVNPLGNGIDLPARITLYSNWGVEVLNSSLVLDSQGVLRVDLQDWIVRGELPERALSAEELEHIQTALSGRRSPLDSLFYSHDLAYYNKQNKTDADITLLGQMLVLRKTGILDTHAKIYVNGAISLFAEKIFLGSSFKLAKKVRFGL